MYCAFVAIPVCASFKRPGEYTSPPAEVALSLSRSAVRICDQFAPSLSSGAGVLGKRDATPVTCADLAIQALVATRLRREGAGELIGEEEVADFDALPLDMQDLVVGLAGSGNVDAVRDALGHSKYDPASSSWLWTCDPIDGSKGLISGASYAVGIARFPGSTGAPDVAALALPAADVDKILLVDGGILSIHPARYDCEDQNGDEAFEVLSKRAANENVSAPNIGGAGVEWYFSPAKEVVRFRGLPPATPLCCGSLVKYGNVALGRGSALVQSLPSKEARVWDHAAGISAVLASGGRVTDLEGEPLIFGRDEGCVESLFVKAPGIVASAAGVDHQWFCSVARDSLLDARL